MFIKLFFPFIVLANYFTIFYICYADKEYKSIKEYPGFFTLYFLLGISSILNAHKVYKYRLRLKLSFYYFYQVSFILYSIISSFAFPGYIYGIDSLYIPYIIYLCCIGVLGLTNISIVYTVYKKKRDILPFHQI